jgi:hypothetical protein
MAIIAVLIGLLVPAVQKIRGAANQLQCQNNMRQNTLAMEHMAIQHKKLPPLLGPYPAGTLGAPTSNLSPNGPPWGNPFFFLIPFIEQDNQWKASYANINNMGDNNVYMTQPGYTPWQAIVSGNPSNYLQPPPSLGYAIKTYLCPADPSTPNDGLGNLQLYDQGTLTIYGNAALCSYAVNAQVFAKCDVLGNVLNYQGKTRIPQDITDGTSNTIMFTERYGNAGFYGDMNTNGQGGAAWAYSGAFTGGSPLIQGTNLFMDTAVPAFNWDPNFLTGLTCQTFQVSPVQWQVNVLNKIPSSPHTGVITVGLCDGSVRTVSEGISPGTWWHACTPSSGDRLDNDW